MWTEMGAGSIGTHSQRAKHFYSFCKFLWYFTSADLRLAPWSYDLSVQPFSKWCTNWQVPLYKGRCQIPWTNRSRKADSFLPLSFVEVAITHSQRAFMSLFSASTIGPNWWSLSECHSPYFKVLESESILTELPFQRIPGAAIDDPRCLASEATQTAVAHPRMCYEKL